MKSNFGPRRRTVTIVATGLFVGAYFAWPWLSAVRQPELATQNEHEVLKPNGVEGKLRNRQSRLSRGDGPKREPLKILSDDELTDFVVDKGNSYGIPDSRQELDQAVADGTAERASSYFRQGYQRDKPYYGEIPLSLCHWNGQSDWGIHQINQLQIRKDFQSKDVTLETPERPEVFVVADGNIYGAQRSAYERGAPIAYRWEHYWAVVYAGSGSSSGPYVMERVRVGEKDAEITLYRPPAFGETMDRTAYWYFVPLGRLSDGPYEVKVRIANSGEVQSSATTALRRATDEEQKVRDKYWEKEQVGNSQYHKKLRHLEELHGAGLQLRLERLAELAHGLPISAADRVLLEGDVEALGKAVDWDRNVYGSQNRQRRELAAPAPGKSLKMGAINTRWDSEPTPWEPSDIPLSDVWLCDGTDATWFASQTYRSVPEFEDALIAATPSEIQQKIREIWVAVDEKHEPPGDNQTRSFSAAGTLESAIDQAHRVFVLGEERPKLFSSEDEMWVVYVASSSFLVRRIDTRYHEDKYSRSKHRGYMIHTSAYVAGADGVDESKLAPVTLALIPLGKSGDVDSVGVGFSCRSVCCRDIGAGDGKLLDVRLPDLWFSGIAGNQDYGAGFKLQRGKIPAK